MWITSYVCILIVHVESSYISPPGILFITPICCRRYSNWTELRSPEWALRLWSSSLKWQTGFGIVPVVLIYKLGVTNEWTTGPNSWPTSSALPVLCHHVTVWRPMQEITRVLGIYVVSIIVSATTSDYDWSFVGTLLSERYMYIL